MEKLKPKTSLNKFFDSFSEHEKRVLFLDYDGTLAAFTRERDKAFPYPGVVERLEVLTSSSHTRLIIISGRSLDNLKSLLKLKRYPEMIGEHGAEVNDNSGLGVELKIDELARSGLLAAQKWAIETGLHKNSERKKTGIAFHWRGLDDQKVVEFKKKVKDKWKEKAGEYNLELHEFDGGLELRYAKVNKGAAVESILNENSNGAIIAYLGDDYTDEDAFETLGDKALKVLVRKEPRKSKADLQIEPPIELLEFLDRWIESDK